MFKKTTNGEYVTSSSKKKSAWVHETPDKMVEILNKQEEQGYEPEIRFNLAKIVTEDESEEVIPEPGIYRLIPASYSRPDVLTKLNIIDRNYKFFPEIFKALDEEVEWFSKSEEFFKNIGIRRSRSVLLWGPPGFSKTAKIHELVLKNKDKIIIFMNSTPSVEMVEALNSIKVDKIIIFEEFATAVNNDGKIANMLNFLDGDNSLDNAFFIITTNHPEVIPKNVLRPSRVDRFIKIDKLTSSDIKNFLEFYLKRPSTQEEMTLMKNQSLANLKEICISSLKESISLEDAVKLLKSREELLKKDFASERKMGIRSSYDDD